MFSFKLINFLFNSENRLVANFYLVPHSCMELGLTCAMDKDYTTAKQWLEKARKDYTGYLYETIVHFRVHCALRGIKAKEKLLLQQQQQQQQVNNQSEGQSLPNIRSNESVSNQKEIVDGKLFPTSTQQTAPPSANSFSEMAKAMQANRSSTEDAMDRLLGL